ncbi:class I SAM-dependent methyltransferase [Velocimicrobium porci]|uniref:Methyltransferase domain-containing protein n=1 Tax=Velocimicrobium porci TaxID=2606634 RepID=A0A6L5Y2A8_9FIRM|nr:class I SAM-dependent methyltransferase [Velocimicrobium porci]MSS64498.1 methyltransferase domain-containing protein [Velocimicrobium porci]
MMDINKELNIYDSGKGIKKIIWKIWRKLNAPLINYTIRLQEELIEIKTEFVETKSLQLENYEKIAENIRNLNSQLDGYDKIVENIRNLNSQLNGYDKIVENVKNLNSQLDGYDKIAENVKNLNSQLDGYDKIAENVKNLNSQLDGYESLLINVRNNNERLEKLDSAIDMYSIKISNLEKLKNQNLKKENITNIEKQDSIRKEIVESNPYNGIDYFDFENYFRGSRTQIKKNQEQYIKYFENKKNVLDLGCGRGEFLELLKENNIEGYGVDLYSEFVDLCNSKGLNAICGDAISVLEGKSHVDGIFAAQLIEHLKLEEIIKLVELSYEKLEKDAYLILETPNPTSLAIYTHAFYMDPSHNKPVHPLTMKYILEKAGFNNVDILYTNTSKIPIEIPKLMIDRCDNIEEFNKAMKQVEMELFGSQDYAIIAKK